MGQFILPLAFVLAFLAVATLAQAIIGSMLEQRTRNQRVNRRMTMLHAGMDRKEVYETLVRKQASAPSTIRNGSLLNIHNRALRYLAQAGIRVSPLLLVAIWLIISLVTWVAVTTLLRSFGNAPSTTDTLTSLVGALGLVGNAEWMVISSMRRRRLRIIEEQLPLALDIVIRSLRAGHPVVSALQLVTTEMGDPIGSEFGLIVDETTYGFELKDALANFARRTGSDDVHFFAVSVAIQTETGGNLAEILENLAKVVRSRITLGKRVKALSSEGRMSAYILSGLPIFLISTIGMSQPAFYSVKFSDPIFWPTVVGIVGLYFTGLMLMHRITNFKY